jgi:hypothetical protein
MIIKKTNSLIAAVIALSTASPIAIAQDSAPERVSSRVRPNPNLTDLPSISVMQETIASNYGTPDEAVNSQVTIIVRDGRGRSRTESNGMVILHHPDKPGPTVLLPESRRAVRPLAPSNRTQIPFVSTNPSAEDSSRGTVIAPDTLEDRDLGMRDVAGTQCSARRQVYQVPAIEGITTAPYEISMERCIDTLGRIIEESHFDGMSKTLRTRRYSYVDGVQIDPELFLVPTDYEEFTQ